VHKSFTIDHFRFKVAHSAEVVGQNGIYAVLGCLVIVFSPCLVDLFPLVHDVDVLFASQLTLAALYFGLDVWIRAQWSVTCETVPI